MSALLKPGAGMTAIDEVSRLLGALEADVSQTKDDVAEMKAMMKEMQAAISTLQALEAQRKGANKVWGLLIAFGGGAMTLLGEWLLSRIGAL